MKTLPNPGFKNKLPNISWKKIYSREYGVSYSEGAILCLSNRFSYHIPKPSHDTIVIPEGNNTAFYIDGTSWIELVESLNNKYTSHADKLREYENGFIEDGNKYLKISKEINSRNLPSLTNKELKKLYQDYQEGLLRYSVYAWTAFILNNYIAEKATKIIDKYINKSGRDSEKQEIYKSLFHPSKRAAILQLQYEIQHRKKMENNTIDNLYENYKWLSCLDIHNNPWTLGEFKDNIKSFEKNSLGRVIPFNKVIDTLNIKSPDLDYLIMAQKFVYIKDARDDFRRQSVYYALPFFEELGKRMGIKRQDISYLQQAEVSSFLDGNIKISKEIIDDRKKGFIVYLDENNNLICLHGIVINKALNQFKLILNVDRASELKGMTASKGIASGKVVIVRGVSDLHKVKEGDVLIAVTTHPDYVPVMRKASAIVTDEGGITSHAAIVAREFGVPCIVGTKQATSILKDGDKVEVNADNGYIKKLN